MYKHHVYSDELYHHGVKGMKWGIRRYQNEDGTYTQKGIKRYALDRDVNDTSRRNIAKIRTGEAKRRLDYAKNNPAKIDNRYRVADLQGRVRSAKRMEKQVRSIDKGAKLASRGKTIGGYRTSNTIVTLGSYYGGKALLSAANSHARSLSATGQMTMQRAKGYNTVSKLIVYGTYGAIAASNIYTSTQKRHLRSYNQASRSGNATIKKVGSSEYADRKAAASKKK